jgi:hypothetical protein
MERGLSDCRFYGVILAGFAATTGHLVRPDSIEEAKTLEKDWD